MKSEIKILVDRIFGDKPKTARAAELKEEIYQNLCDRYDELIKSGKSDYEAMDAVKAAVGDFSAVLDELNSDDADKAPKEVIALDVEEKSKAKDDVPPRQDMRVNPPSGEYKQNSNNKRPMQGWLRALIVFSCLIIGLMFIATVAQTFRVIRGRGSDGIAFGYDYSDSERYIKSILGDGVNYADFDADEIDSINIDWLGGQVIFKRGEGESIHISEIDSYPGENLEFRYRLYDGMLDIKFSRPLSVWRFFKSVNYTKTITITLPESKINIEKIKVNTVSANVTVEWFGDDSLASYLNIKSVSGNVKINSQKELHDLDVYTVSGNITVDRLGGLDNCNLQTMSGKISLIDCTVRDNMLLTSVSGEIDVRGCLAEYFEADSTSGSIGFSGVADEIDCRTVSGEINIDIPSASEIIAKTTSGKVRLTLSDCPGYSVDFESVSGSFKNQNLVTSGGNKYYSGDGSCKIKVKTVSGDFIIK